MNRRGFLSSILALAAAPAVVRAQSIMRIKPLVLLDRPVLNAIRPVGLYVSLHTSLGEELTRFVPNKIVPSIGISALFSGHPQDIQLCEPLTFEIQGATVIKGAHVEVIGNNGVTLIDYKRQFCEVFTSPGSLTMTPSISVD